jgi:hypothetical protein
MPAIHTTPDNLLTQQAIEVTSEGELVAIRVGNSTLRIHYEDALKLSQWIRVRGKEAKRKAGDMSRHWSAIALLEDLK